MDIEKYRHVTNTFNGDENDANFIVQCFIEYYKNKKSYSLCSIGFHNPKVIELTLSNQSIIDILPPDEALSEFGVYWSDSKITQPKTLEMLIKNEKLLRKNLSIYPTLYSREIYFDKVINEIPFDEMIDLIIKYNRYTSFNKSNINMFTLLISKSFELLDKTKLKDYINKDSDKYLLAIMEDNEVTTCYTSKKSSILPYIENVKILINMMNINVTNDMLSYLLITDLPDPLKKVIYDELIKFCKIQILDFIKAEFDKLTTDLDDSSDYEY